MELISSLTPSEGSDSFKPNDSLIIKVAVKKEDLELYMGSKQWEDGMAFFVVSSREITVTICV
jgi:hypothetical protein